MTGERRYSRDLAKGGMEFIFKTSNAKLYNQMKENTSEKLVELEKRREIGLGNSLKKKETKNKKKKIVLFICPCLLYTSPSPRDGLLSRMPSSA